MQSLHWTFPDFRIPLGSRQMIYWRMRCGRYNGHWLRRRTRGLSHPAERSALGHQRLMKSLRSWCACTCAILYNNQLLPVGRLRRLSAEALEQWFIG